MDSYGTLESNLEANEDIVETQLGACVVVDDLKEMAAELLFLDSLWTVASNVTSLAGSGSTPLSNLGAAGVDADGGNP